MDAFNRSAIIDCYYLDGDAVIENLREGSTIALASFINAGEVYKIACGLAEGFNDWCVKIAKTLPKGKSVNPDTWKSLNFS